MVYEIFAATPCDLSDARQFAAEIKKKFPGSELAADEPFAGKLVVPIAPSVDCYSAKADSYRVEIYGHHAPHDVMHALDWSLPQAQLLRRDFGPAEPYISFGIGFVGTGINPRHKTKSWQSHIGVMLNFETVSAEDRANKFAELIGLAGFEKPKSFVEEEIVFLPVADNATYSMSSLKPDLNTASAVANPDSIKFVVDNDAETVLALVEKLQEELGVGEPITSTFAFNGQDADDYGQLKDRFNSVVSEGSVWHVKPKIPFLSDPAKQALAGDGDGDGLDVLPLLEINENKVFHPVSLVRHGDQWQIIVGTHEIDRKAKLQKTLTPFVNGWA